MILDTLKLANYRNYDSLNLKFNPHINILYGNNAQGKTNILESIYLLSSTNSHKRSENSQLVKNGCKKTKISAVIKKNGIKNKAEIVISESEKKLIYNTTEIKKVSDYIFNSMDVILFTPDDLELIKGSPNIRRLFINDELSKLSEGYFNILNDYNKLLKIRNDYLKKINNNISVDKSYFDIITNYLIDKGVLLYKMRKKFINKLSKSALEIYKKLFNLDNFNINYICNYFEDENNIKNEFTEILKTNYKKELQNGMTLFGPHRDDMEFFLDKDNLRDFGSQGQQRAAVLCMKLAEIAIYKNSKFQNPIILLDDIFSEFDDIKKNNILKILKNDTQVFITTTDLAKINKKKIENANYYKVKAGKIIKIEEEYKYDKQ